MENVSSQRGQRAMSQESRRWMMEKGSHKSRWSRKDLSFMLNKNKLAELKWMVPGHHLLGQNKAK